MKTSIKIYAIAVVALFVSCNQFKDLSPAEKEAKVCEEIINYVKTSDAPICKDFMKALDRNYSVYEFDYPWIKENESKIIYPYIGIYGDGIARVEAFMNTSLSYYKIGYDISTIKFALNFSYDSLTGKISNPVGLIEYQNAPQPKDSTHYVTLKEGELFSDYLK